MSSAKAILLGSVLIAVSILIANTINPARAAINGPYTLMHHSNTSANAGVFRIDQSTGDVSYCFVTGESQLICSGSVR